MLKQQKYINNSAHRNYFIKEKHYSWVGAKKSPENTGLLYVLVKIIYE